MQGSFLWSDSLLLCRNMTLTLDRYAPGDFAIDVGRNVCHGSDSVENAQKEIALWFKDEEKVSWKPAEFDWVYEKP